MKINKLIKIIAAVSLLSAPLVHADTILLKDGRKVEGELKGKSSDGKMIKIDASGIEMTIPKDDIASIRMGSSSNKTSSQAKTEAKSTTKEKSSNASHKKATIAAGTMIHVRMSESVDSRHGQKGQRFTAKLEANLMSGDTVVLAKGATVYGTIIDVKKSRRLVGSASLSIALTNVLVDGEMLAFVSDSVSGEGPNEAGDTVKKTARAAAIGGLVDGSSGAKTGAKVGVAAAILTRGHDIQVPKDSLVTFALQAPFTL